MRNQILITLALSAVAAISPPALAKGGKVVIGRTAEMHETEIGN
jgi:hypothetical protein